MVTLSLDILQPHKRDFCLFLFIWVVVLIEEMVSIGCIFWVIWISLFLILFFPIFNLDDLHNPFSGFGRKSFKSTHFNSSLTFPPNQLHVSFIRFFSFITIFVYFNFCAFSSLPSYPNLLTRSNCRNNDFDFVKLIMIDNQNQ